MQCVREKAGLIDVDSEDVDPAILESLVIQQVAILWALTRTLTLTLTILGALTHDYGSSPCSSPRTTPLLSLTSPWPCHLAVAHRACNG